MATTGAQMIDKKDEKDDDSSVDEDSIQDDSIVYESNSSNVISKFLKKVRKNHHEAQQSHDQKQYKMKYLKREAKKVKQLVDQEMYDQQVYAFKKEITKDQKNMKKESMRLINSLRVYQINDQKQITTEDSKSLLEYKKRNTQAFTARSNIIKKTIQNEIYKDNKVIPSRTSNILNLTVPLKHLNNQGNQDSYEFESSNDFEDEVSKLSYDEKDEDYHKYQLERQEIFQHQGVQEYVKNVIVEDVLLNTDQSQNALIKQSNSKSVANLFGNMNQEDMSRINDVNIYLTRHLSKRITDYNVKNNIKIDEANKQQTMIDMITGVPSGQNIRESSSNDKSRNIFQRQNAYARSSSVLQETSQRRIGVSLNKDQLNAFTKTGNNWLNQKSNDINDVVKKGGKSDDGGQKFILRRQARYFFKDSDDDEEDKNVKNVSKLPTSSGGDSEKLKGIAKLRWAGRSIMKETSSISHIKQGTLDTQEILRLLKLNHHVKQEKEIEFMKKYFYEFDFLKEQKKQLGEKEQKKEAFSIFASDGNAQTANQMAKDQKAIEQMCRMMKYLYIPAQQMVFDYDSNGDLFYMVLKGSVSCKVPHAKQVIHLSEEEYKLFNIHYQNDIISLNEAKDLNKQCKPCNDNKKSGSQDKISINHKRTQSTIDMSTLQFFKNPYDLPTCLQIQNLVSKIQEKETLSIKNRIKENIHAQLKRDKQMKRLIAENNGQYESSQTTSSEDSSSCCSEDKPEQPESIISEKEEQSDASSIAGSQENKRISSGNSHGHKKHQNIYKIMEKDNEYKNLLSACSKMKEVAGEDLNRKYYYLSIMKTVKIYEGKGSFGELALLTNKKRKAKLETLSNTHFAVLSKRDYRNAQFKAQNSKLKEKTSFLKNFDLFSKLSETYLTTLSYSMQVERFNRGQYIYKEGISKIDKIYLVCKGDFQLSKEMIVQFDEGKIAQLENQPEEVFSYKNYMMKEQFNKNSNFAKKVKMDKVDVCILSQNDLFGYQEFLERDIELRSCSVMCLKNDSFLVSIEKNAILSILRRHSAILDQMKMQWTKFMIKRMADKISIEQKVARVQMEKKRQEEVIKIKLPKKIHGKSRSMVNLQIEELQQKYTNLDIGLQNQDESNIKKPNKSPKQYFKFKSRLGECQLFDNPAQRGLLEKFADKFVNKFEYFEKSSSLLSKEQSIMNKDDAKEIQKDGKKQSMIESATMQNVVGRSYIKSHSSTLEYQNNLNTKVTSYNQVIPLNFIGSDMQFSEDLTHLSSLGGSIDQLGVYSGIQGVNYVHQETGLAGDLGTNVRIEKELIDLQKEMSQGNSIFLSEFWVVGGDTRNLKHFKAKIHGPLNTCYQHGIFLVDLQIPAEYPFSPPIIKFDSQVWHPNVNFQTGAIDINLQRDWNPSLNLKTTLIAIQALLSLPNFDVFPQNQEAARQLFENMELFKLTAQDYANKNSSIFQSSLRDSNNKMYPAYLQDGSQRKSTQPLLNVQTKMNNSAITFHGGIVPRRTSHEVKITPKRIKTAQNTISKFSQKVNSSKYLETTLLNSKSTLLEIKRTTLQTPSIPLFNQKQTNRRKFVVDTIDPRNAKLNFIGGGFNGMRQKNTIIYSRMKSAHQLKQQQKQEIPKLQNVQKTANKSIIKSKMAKTHSQMFKIKYSDEDCHQIFTKQI